jgi:protocatechuate 3,4-dioxygenase beta subunit
VKRAFLQAAFGVLLISAAASASFAQSYSRPEPLGAISGTVLDAHGKPVADASVTIQTSDGLHPHATHTDSSGRFEFTRYVIGQYDLRAYSNGVFSDWDKRVLIRSKKTTEVTLRLVAQ